MFNNKEIIQHKTIIHKDYDEAHIKEVTPVRVKINNQYDNEYDETLAEVLEKGVLKEETSRAAYTDTDENVPQDKLFFGDNKSKELTKLQLHEQEIEIKDNEERIRFDSDEHQWLFACSNTTDDGSVYNIDKDGNLIAKIDINTIWNRLGVDKGIVKLSDIDKEKLLKIVKESKKQINFIQEQERLKEEINGYPEYNEGFAKLYKPESIIPRFKTEYNLLRTMFHSRDNSDLRLLLSIITYKSVDYFNQLISDKVINSIAFPILINSNDMKIYTYIKNYVDLYNKFPEIKSCLIGIGLPYSKDFFDSYLFEETALDYEIERRYIKLRKIYCDKIADYLKEHPCESEILINTLRKLDFMTTPPNNDVSYDNLKEVIDKQQQDINLSTGIKELDNHNAFIKKGKISTVFAYTGSFKTMFCSNVAYNIMKNQGNVLYFSLEINKEEMYINFLSRYSYDHDKKVSHSDIKSNKLSDTDKDYLFNRIYPDFSDNLKSHLIVYDETDITSNTYSVFSKLLLQADNNFTKRTGHGIDLVIIDHLNLLKFDSGEKAYNDYSAINHWMSYFRKNAVNFLEQKRQIAILCACQSSREGFKKAKHNGRYDLTSIAEGNEIERSSQLVLSIYTTDKDRIDNNTKMQILKSRDNELYEELITIGLEPKYYTFGLEAKQISSKEDNSINKKSRYDNASNYKNPIVIET